MSEYKCSVCGKDKDDDSHFYKTKMLCNKHYIQMYRYGEIVDDKPHHTRKTKGVCDICKDTTSSRYRICNSEDEYNGLELCVKHYGQYRKHQKVLDNMPSAKNIERVCSICGSTNRPIYSRLYNGMFCQKHYSQLYNLGGLKEITVYDRNQYRIEDNVAYIMLRNQKNENIAETMIDVEDLERVLEHKWYLGTWGYAENGKLGLIQRFILNEYNSEKIPDHINRNPLDNRRCNLRIVDKSMNAVNCDIRLNNTSGVTGVSWDKYASSWRSYINYQGKRIELGHSKNKDDAIIKRLEAENYYYPGMQPQVELFEKYGVEAL